MPVYEYVCRECDHHLEVSQSFKDEPLTTCPVCEGPLRKVFGSIGIVLKGSGFYRTDSRLPAKKEKDRSEAPKAEPAAKSEKSDAKSDSKPAAAESKTSGSKASESKPASAAKTA